MTKIQGWVIIVLLLVVVFILTVRNGNEAEDVQNKIKFCVDSCHANIILKTDEDIPILQTCVNKCVVDNGGASIYNS